MAQITVDTSGLDVTARQLALLTGQQLATATALALKATATATRDHLRQELAKPSGGPIEGGATRWTIGGTYASRYIQPSDLQAEVGFASTQPRAAGRYLGPLLTGSRPVTKGIDLKLGGGRGRVFIPARSLGRTPQGNVPRATLSRVVQSEPFLLPLRGGVAMGLYVRSGRGQGRNRTSWLTLLGVLSPSRPRRQTLDLERMLAPVVQSEFRAAMAGQLQETLRRAGLD